MGWWIALGVVVLLAVLPLGVSVKYNSEGPLVRVILGPVKLTVFPLSKKKKKDKKDKKGKKQPKTEQIPEQPKAEQPPKQSFPPSPKNTTLSHK